MGLLDDDNYKPRYTPPEPKRYRNQTALTQEQRDEELNNLGRKEVTEDFADSNFADRV
jgi:hypothetical protein